MKKLASALAVICTFSQLSEAKIIISENFDKFTQGNESSYIPVSQLDGLTAAPGWTGAEVNQAGGCAYLGVGGSLTTPPVDLSGNNGNYIVKFRAKSSTPGALYFIMDSNMSYSVDYLSDEWKEYSIALSGGVNGSTVNFLSTYNDLLIDDIVIDDGGIAIPHALAASDFTRESFTANWEEVPNAESYILNVYTLEYDNETTIFSPNHILKNKEVKGTSYVVTEGVFDEPYYYTVASKSGTTVSDPSSIITVSPTEVSTPQALNATEVSADSFTANWLASDIATKYYVHVLKHHVADHAETYSIIDTDFSEIVSEGTIDKPQRELEYLFDGDWSANMPILANGIIGINNQDINLFGQAFLQSPLLDLSKCGGSVSISFDAFGRKGLSKAMVRMANVGNTISFADTQEFEVTEQSAHQSFTLSGGSVSSYVVITSEEPGMMFIDNLKVTVELPGGASFVMPVRTIESGECQTAVSKLNATDSDVIAYYVVGAWSVRHGEGEVRQIPEVLSDPSDIIRVSRPASISDINSDRSEAYVSSSPGTITIFNPLCEAVAIYTADGRRLSVGTSMAATSDYCVAAGMYIVTVGKRAFKVSVGR